MKLSIVVPCYNEEEAVPVFLSTVSPILETIGIDYEIVFIDDGSKDSTVKVITGMSARYPATRLVELSRNFGKEAAMTAGFTYASGDAIIPMDVDLQDPPELIPAMIQKWQDGVKVVHAVRRSRESDSWLKRSTASAFYRLMEDITDVKIPSNCGDYRLMDRAVVNAILDAVRFMKGIRAAAGFKAAQVEYDRPERAAGHTKFNFWKLWNFALDGITGFSTFPLRVWTYIGGIIALFSFAYAFWIVTKTMIWGVVTPGFATLTSVVLFLGGVQLIVAETKRRPLFLVGALHGFDERGAGPSVVQLETAAAARGGF